MFNLVFDRNQEPDSLPYYEERLQKPNNEKKLKVLNSIMDCIGNTPMIKLNKIPKDHGLSCEIYAKCEFLNPGGSIKDRIGLSMLKDAIDKGYVKDDSILLEGTSGNTGIAIAFAATSKGNNCIIVTKDKNAGEKLDTMRYLGAEVISLLDNMNETNLVRQIKENDPDGTVMLSQFENDVNPRTHYDTTAVEILSAMDGKVDMVVMGAGTGGTITGVGHRVKKECPKCVVAAIEPDGSTFFRTGNKGHPFLIEGIGGQEIPITTDVSVVDHVEVVNDKEAFLMARELAQKEGLLCGGSSGAAMVAAIKTAAKLGLGAGKRVVVVLPDGIRNYMSKFVTDQWMEAHLFKAPPQHTMKWWNQPITKLRFQHKYPIINEKSTCKQAVKKMSDGTAAIVVNKKGYFIGAVTKDSLRNSATNPIKLPGNDSEDFNFYDPVVDHLVKRCYTLAKNGKTGMPTIGLLSRILDITPFVVIGKEVKECDNDYFMPESVATGDDILDFIFQM